MVKGEKCLGQSTSGVLPNSYYLNNGLRLNWNPKQISSISPKGYKVAFQLWQIKLMKIFSMSKMKMLDLKKPLCPLQFKDFPPPLESSLCLYNYREVNAGFWNCFFTLPFPMPVPHPCTPMQNHIHTVPLAQLPLQTLATTPKPKHAPPPNTNFSAHFTVRCNENKDSYPVEEPNPTTVYQDLCIILCIPEMAKSAVDAI